ncbi:MAG: nucleotidyltransferase domain-containing protein [Bacteroidia bacterium]|nr:nucleotidyltransferase domain-containing protein [Bacteroidia bacterium]
MGELKNIDANPKDIKTILSILENHLPGIAIWAFGSRVKFTSTPRSDLDLVAFIEPETKYLMSDIKEAFDESDLPFRVDIHDWNLIPENFRKNIIENYIVLSNGNKGKSK